MSRTRINIKTQTNRSTQWREGLNCVNLFVNDFQMGLRVTEWGQTSPIEPLANFSIGAKEITLTIGELRQRLGID